MRKGGKKKKKREKRERERKERERERKERERNQTRRWLGVRLNNVQEGLLPEHIHSLE